MKIECLNTDKIIDFNFYERGRYLSQDCAVIDIDNQKYVISSQSLNKIIHYLKGRLIADFDPEKFEKELVGSSLSLWTEKNLIRPVGTKLDLSLEDGNDKLYNLAEQNGLIWEDIRFVDQNNFDDIKYKEEISKFGEDETRLWIVYDDSKLKVTKVVWG